MNSDIVCCIVLYRPTRDQIMEIVRVSKVLSRVAVFWNHYTEDDKGLANILSSRDTIEIYRNRENCGLSANYQKCLELVENEKYLILLDQDTAYSDEDLSEFIITSRNLFQMSPKVSAIAPNIECDYDPERSRKKFTSPTYVPWIINSGTLFRIEHLREIGGFDTNLFVDHVDLDVSYALTALGYKLLQLPEPILRQSLGRRAARLGFKTYLHSSWRLERQVRDRIYLYRKHNSAHMIIPYMVKASLKQMFFGDRIFARLHSIFRGFYFTRKELNTDNRKRPDD
ncbi:hypothetical protein [Sulfitobacter sp. 1A15299]|uniref:hypothetical protein n=1 Tax=Sulfitobacter sp. 1A15299 TaxID=3368598 RepID=UPI003744C174